jgi:hypothetical protein
MGGLLSIMVIRKAYVLSIQEAVDGTVYGDIEVQEGKEWVQWDVTHESAGTESQGIVTREGFAKGNRLRFSVPKDRPAIKAMFEQASNDELIVLFQDANGKHKIFGQLHAPVRFRYNHNSGTALSDKNAYECEFYYNGLDNIFDYDGTQPVPPAGPPPALVYVNGELVAALAPGESINFDTPFDFTFLIVGTPPEP